MNRQISFAQGPASARVLGPPTRCEQSQVPDSECERDFQTVIPRTGVRSFVFRDLVLFPVEELGEPVLDDADDCRVINLHKFPEDKPLPVGCDVVVLHGRRG